MLNIFQIYLYICGAIVSISILAGLIGLALNLIVYVYQSVIGFNKFKKIVKEYNEKKLTEKDIK